VQREAKSTGLRLVHEALLALNMASATVSTVFLTSRDASLPFVHLEIRINHLLHIRQTDFIRGHFAFWIPAIAMAGCLWLLLLALSRNRSTGELQRWFTGLIAFFLFPLVGTYAYKGGPFLWHPYLTPLEFAAIFTVFLLVSSRFISGWVGATAAVGHYGFWCWLQGGISASNWERSGYIGPIGPAIGLFSSIVWMILEFGIPEFGIRGQTERSPFSAD
jgi:hypothetical protein